MVRFSATAGVPAITAVSIRVLPEFFQHKELLVRFGKFAFKVFGVFGLEKLTGSLTFGCDSLFDFAGLHSIVVIQLCDLLGQIVVDGRAVGVDCVRDARARGGEVIVHACDPLLCLTSGIRNLCKNVPLSELGGVSVLRQSVLRVGEAGGDHVFQLADQGDLLCIRLDVVVCASFEFSRVRGVADGKIHAERISRAGVRRAESSISPAAAEAAEAAPAEEEKQKNPRPASIPAVKAGIAAICAVQKSHSFPTIETGGSLTCRVYVVNRYCVHIYTPFMFCFVFFFGVCSAC